MVYTTDKALGEYRPEQNGFFHNLARKWHKLAAHPAFRDAPFQILARGAAWSCYVLARVSPVFRLMPDGPKVQVPANFRYSSLTAYLVRDWTEDELRYLALFLKPGDVFVDVGANIGLFALKAGQLVGSHGHVVAVEPGKAVNRILLRNIAHNPELPITLVQKALSDSCGTARFYHTDRGHDPMAYSLVDDGGQASYEEVETITLDRLVGDLGLKRLDCLKIDVEGAEPAVLDGAFETLRKFRPIVIFEANGGTALADGQKASDAWDRLAEHGYRFYRLLEGSPQPINYFPDDFCNIIAHPA